MSVLGLTTHWLFKMFSYISVWPKCDIVYAWNLCQARCWSAPPTRPKHMSGQPSWQFSRKRHQIYHQTILTVIMQIVMVVLKAFTVFPTHDPQHLIFTNFFLNTCKYIPMFCPVWRICIWNVYFVSYKAKSHISGDAKRPGVSAGRFHHRFYCHPLWEPAKNEYFLLTHLLKINLLMASITASDILGLKCC